LENEHRKTLSSLDKAHAVEKLKEQGKKTEEIAKLFSLSSRQIERYQKIASFPDALKKALHDEVILAKHGLLLAQALKRNPRLDLKTWIETIKAEELSAEALKKRLAKEVKKVKKPKKLIEKRKDGFRLYPFAFDSNTTGEVEQGNMIKALEDALTLLKQK
jgi:23S rRNA G2069 N7-methylase RlmK/C1962 C5-methylase RlmI